ncbi:metallophosphoesterase [Nocardiopsis synnemataformans]|uniref:metallophosphoesterase n=1 Tax=Nocardiopsis synnemataformans TaxID=61305 RepID=UPI003EBB7AD6
MSTRTLAGVVATTDLHSHLDNAASLVDTLWAKRSTHLVVDSGDMFEGTGYYRARGGNLETQLLRHLYDAVVPGNHGYRHYRSRELAPLVVCCNITSSTGTPVWAPVQLRRIGGRRVAVTGIMSASAWSCVPAAERRGHQLIDPAPALHRLIRSVDATEWVVLSHSGFEHDQGLAARLPALRGVVFAGHCHSALIGPTRAGQAVVVKGAEHGAGFAAARLEPTGWRFLRGLFPITEPDVAELPLELTSLLDDIRSVRTTSRTIAPTTATYRHAVPHRTQLTERLARHAHHRTRLPVLLNETALRPARVGAHLSEWDLAELDPFDNHLVSAHLPEPLTAGTLDRLIGDVGPLAVVPAVASPTLAQVVTTAYLATTHLDARSTTPTGVCLRDLLIREMTTPSGEAR